MSKKAKKIWTKVPDNTVRHIWCWPDGTHETKIDPSWYADNGTPVCGEGKFSDDDMHYVRTEVSSDSHVKLSRQLTQALDESKRDQRNAAMSQAESVRLLDKYVAYKMAVEPTLHAIFDVLYFDSDKNCFDPDKEWDSAADFLDMVHQKMIDLYGRPKKGSTDYPKFKTRG